MILIVFGVNLKNNNIIYNSIMVSCLRCKFVWSVKIVNGMLFMFLYVEWYDVWEFFLMLMIYDGVLFNWLLLKDCCGDLIVKERDWSIDDGRSD